MPIMTRRARITGPVSYRAGTGQQETIPIGPCLLERSDGQSIDIVWGDLGQSCAGLPIEEVKAAQDHGHLVLLD